MNIINNIKYQYNYKLLKDLIEGNDYQSFFEKLKSTSGNKKIYLQLLSNLGNTAIQNYNEEIFQTKIVWINSYMREDSNYVENFIKFYINHFDENININNYEEEVINILEHYENVKEINFNDLVNYSYLYQFLILETNRSKKFLSNQMPFFSFNNKLNFTKPNLTQCYFFIIDHPYSIYQKIKKLNDNNVEVSRNIFLNLDNQSNPTNFKNTKIDLNKKGWHTHANSWLDSNVLNSLNGKILIKKDIVNQTFDVLSSVILHLLQSGSKIELDYNLIQKFIDQNPPLKMDDDIDLSQKEKKFLDPYVDGIIKSLNF